MRDEQPATVWNDERGWRVGCPDCGDSGTYADDEHGARLAAVTHVCPSPPARKTTAPPSASGT